MSIYLCIVCNCYVLQKAEGSSRDRGYVATKPDIFTIWLFTENVCQSWYRRPPYCCLQPVSDSPLFLKKSLKLSTGPTRLLAHRLVPRDLRATPILLFSFTSEHVACSLLFPSAKLFLTPRRSARAVLSTRRFCPSAAPSPSPTAELTPALRAVCSGQFSHPTYGYVSSP